MTKVYAQIARCLAAIARCEASGRDMSAAIDNHQARLDSILCEGPSGSGIDAGFRLDREASKPNRLVFATSFHHMNEVGMYDGWTQHRVIVTPCLAHGFSIRVTGRDRNAIKDYLGDVFHHWLTSEVKE